MERWIALLRGINLGPSRRVSMPDLRAALADAGYGNVRTLLQSGNVVLDADGPADELAAAIERVIEGRCGVPDVQVVVRTRDELADAIAHNPLPDGVAAPRFFQVSFCPAEPPPEVVERIEAVERGDERFAIRGREIYAFHAGGIQGSALAKVLADKRLGILTTARNWNTVTKLLALADG